MKEISNSSGFKKKKIVAAVLISIAAAGFGFFKFYPMQQPDPHTSIPESNVANVVSSAGTPNDEAPITSSLPESESVATDLNERLEEINNLRDTLLIKLGEIEELKLHYRKAIDRDVENTLIEKSSKGIDTFQQALTNKCIDLSLRTIQRRQSYIQNLDHPARWLDQASEELLYLKRNIQINLQLASVTRGIDLDGLSKQSKMTLNNYRRSSSELAFDIKSADLQPLEKIWNMIVEKEKQYVLGKLIPKDVDVADKENEFKHQKHNRLIWDEICNGNYSRKNELTVISVEAAKCLAQGGDADMFLNNVSDLNPEALRHLIRWEGNWLCFNGIQELSPEAAQILFRWKGNWISLNGITELTPESTRYLQQWNGKQLELMGLNHKHMQNQPRVVELLARWEKSGGKLYVPGRIRQEIEKFENR